MSQGTSRRPGRGRRPRPGGRAGNASGSSPTPPLKVHHLRPAPGSKQAKLRAARGDSGRKGKQAGRGTKGTGARGTVAATFEGGQMPLHMRLPKLRGFHNPFGVQHQVVNVERLAVLFPDGGDVTASDLAAAGAVRSGHRVKVLGQGEISVPLRVEAQAFSASARAKIEAAGGTAVEVTSRR